VIKDLTQKVSMIPNPTNSLATTKQAKRKLPRARKARARLRQQNKLRAAAVRNN
jgi:hypothetical protein